MAFRRTIILIALLFLLVPSATMAEQPILRAVEISEPPVIDGDLSDPCWKMAAKTEDFYISADGSRPAEQTEASICYDKKSIYIAFFCKDSQPDKIAASETRRGSDSISNDDLVEVNIDCFGNFDQVVWIDVSANGTQVEHLQSGDVSKIEWRGDWKATSKITQDGYNVEIALPWSILQYDPKRTSMGIAFARQHIRSGSKWWTSPNIGNNWDSKKFYSWEGLHLPSYNKKPLLLGYTCIGGGQGSSFGSSGIDLKHSFTPELTGVLAVNPDFRDLEQQVQSVDFSYTEKYLSDSRPYFQEGANFFPGSDLLYTRRINQIDLGGKFMGTVGDFSMGMMHASGPDGGAYDVVGLNRLWAGKGHLGFAAVNGQQFGNRNLSGVLSGDLLLFDKNWRKITLSTNYETSGAEAGSLGRKVDFELEGTAPPRAIEWKLSHQEISSNFDPLLGYVPENDLSAWKASMHLFDAPSKGSLREWAISSYVTKADHLGGEAFHDDAGIGMSCVWTNDSHASLFLDGSNRPPYHDGTIGLGYGWLKRNQYRSGVALYTFGRKSGGNYAFMSLSQNWDVARRLLINGYYAFSRISAPSPNAYSVNQAILSVTYQIDNERSLSTRIVAQSGKINTFFAYRQRVRAGMDAYLLFGDPNANSTKNIVTMKFVRPLF